MRVIFCLVVGFILIQGLVCTPFGREGHLDDWTDYKIKYGKIYRNEDEHRWRREIFESNKREVLRFNEEEAPTVGYIKGLNRLSDWSIDEANILNGIVLPQNWTYFLENSEEEERFLQSILKDPFVEAPKSVDWRQVPGRVTSVKDQGYCGSCWSFSALGSIEAQELSHGKEELVDLSEQNLVDCSDRDNGCNGGFTKTAMQFVASQGGVDDDASYPYQAAKNKCRFNLNNVAFTVKGGAALRSTDEEMLRQVVAKFGPVSVVMDATNLRSYWSGVYYNSNCNPMNLNHGVLLVGYGTSEEFGPYWIVKNSWGEDWGEKGYFRIARNKGNHCGIASFPVIPTF